MLDAIAPLVEPSLPPITAASAWLAGRPRPRLDQLFRDPAGCKPTLHEVANLYRPPSRLRHRTADSVRGQFSGNIAADGARATWARKVAVRHDDTVISPVRVPFSRRMEKVRPTGEQTGTASH